MAWSVQRRGHFCDQAIYLWINYLLKMSDYKRGEWCGDGLYWRFIERHRDFFRQPALGLDAKLDRLKPEQRELIFAAAGDFLQTH